MGSSIGRSILGDTGSGEGGSVTDSTKEVFSKIQSRILTPSDGVRYMNEPSVARSRWIADSLSKPK